MSTHKFEVLDPEWAANLQRGLGDYMTTLYDSIDSGEEVETESGAPYCGCNDCEDRELLTYMAPRIIVGYQQKKIDLVDSGG
jgi:hypothetical protein